MTVQVFSFYASGILCDIMFYENRLVSSTAHHVSRHNYLYKEVSAMGKRYSRIQQVLKNKDTNIHSFAFEYSVKLKKYTYVPPKRSIRHGMHGKPVYTSWAGMFQRCYNLNNKSFPYYGGRGIRVCVKWHSFINFYEDMGDRPKGMSLDRIDNDGNYEPSNCRWATTSEQNKNKRGSKKYGRI